MLDLERFAQLGVATVYEASGRRGLIDRPLLQLIDGSRVAGPARIARCGPADNLMVHAVVERIVPGDVVVLAAPGSEPVALVGELLALQAKIRGAAALLVDGAVRDVAELQALGLPVWASHVRVRGATKTEVGELDVPVEVGGTTIRPGDVVVLDDDGAVVVERERVLEVLEASEGRLRREAALRERLEGGELSFDLHGLRKVIDGG